MELRHGMSVENLVFRKPSIGEILSVEWDEANREFEVYYNCNSLGITRCAGVDEFGFFLNSSEPNDYDVVEKINGKELISNHLTRPFRRAVINLSEKEILQLEETENSVKVIYEKREKAEFENPEILSLDFEIPIDFLKTIITKR